ncbi:hypothetical protein QEG60_004415 [Pluralibacter gergoviae]|uniref:hypothetical protein n=1 Tax=Pluralibacter gergoviae TaxID=61647 RepID=UPI000A3BE7DB|nr:hypothetical protein [Pluralibacter gergoviae]EKV3545656.1 hypothetical protein [Pluralibacter gergoviae]EKV9901902.1 hypothetical protein [Pluralibacter gergoviae]EKV9933888.1 hypothetical protein [Pluralibacter gergoviae]OUF45584.1 hypothetical protein AZ034_000053 [Pluralibacter gergoviae]OUF48185.1 hypothetical protein AZ044_003394 [Pluralibacter gergoviae]
MNVNTMDLQGKLQVSMTKAAALLPAEVGQHLLALITPQALATMAGIVVIWAGSHFFGIGEIADVILLIVGWAAVGGVAVEAGKKLYDFAIKTNNAKTEADLDAAAHDLADAITLLGVDTVLALLLRKKPGDTFKTTKGNMKISPYSSKVKASMASRAPRNTNPSWRYRPKIRFTNQLNAGEGSTNIWGDITVGRRYDPTHRTSDEASKDLLVAIYHERVHQFVAPKFYLLRELRSYVRTSAYYKSFILRYLEEAFAETIGQLRANGMSYKYIVRGFKFPIADNYEITFTALRHEMAGILLGPVVVGGITYNVFYGMQNAH